jgi:hypothetical protein
VLDKISNRFGTEAIGRGIGDRWNLTQQDKQGEK